MCMFKDSKIYSCRSAEISLCVYCLCAFICVFLFVLAPSPLSSWGHQQQRHARPWQCHSLITSAQAGGQCPACIQYTVCCPACILYTIHNALPHNSPAKAKTQNFAQHAWQHSIAQHANTIYLWPA